MVLVWFKRKMFEDLQGQTAMWSLLNNSGKCGEAEEVSLLRLQVLLLKRSVDEACRDIWMDYRLLRCLMVRVIICTAGWFMFRGAMICKVSRRMCLFE